MKKTIVMTLASLIFSQAVASAVIDQDWQTPGDENLLFDTVTNMRWLDLSVTADISHDTVVTNLGTGGLFEGWRLATQEEVLELWGHAGITNTERNWVTYQYAEVNDLVTRLGPTVMVEPGLFPIATHTIGMVEGGPALTSSERWSMELTYAPDGFSTRTSASHYTWDIGNADPHYSTYLVKTVPLPAAVWLFGFGFVGLLGVARRKKADYS
ncbi:VPLPA-CTERM sorting domain-containing protein [Pseudomonadota bacterium]